jgi:hypothetical protein
MITVAATVVVAAVVDATLAEEGKAAAVAGEGGKRARLLAQHIILVLQGVVTM